MNKKLFIIFIIILIIIISGCSTKTGNKSVTNTDNTVNPSGSVDNGDQAATNAINPEFSLGKGDYIIPDSDKRKLTENDLQGLSKQNIDLARNEIYARHGYIFKTALYKNYFEKKSWYKPDMNFSESIFSEIEKYNVKFILDYVNLLSKSITLVNNNEGEYDLNGDGTKEKVKASFKSDGSGYTLSVNTLSLKVDTENVDKKLYVCNIDTGDKYMELAIMDNGASDDYMIQFYGYDNSALAEIGHIDSSINSTNIKGNGKISAECRGSILQTWFFMFNFNLTSNHKIVETPQSIYSTNYALTVKKALTLQKSQTDIGAAYTLSVGENITITGTDNKQWCRIKNSSGQIGWFAVESYNKIKSTGEDASEYFDGLCNAD